MRVVLSSVTFDPLGVVELSCLPSTNPGETRRRVNRIATLDGGAAFNDFGYSEADRTIELKWTPRDAATGAAVARLVQLYQRIRVSMPGGIYLCAPEVYKPGASESSLILLVASKLA